MTSNVKDWSMGNTFKKTYGINCRSILNNSRYYHVIGGLPPDAMHDILGVLHYTIKEVLKVLIIDQQLFTLEELNNRILSLIMVTTIARINPLQYKGTDFYLMITV